MQLFCCGGFHGRSRLVTPTRLPLPPLRHPPTSPPMGSSPLSSPESLLPGSNPYSARIHATTPPARIKSPAPPLPSPRMRSLPPRLPGATGSVPRLRRMRGWSGRQCGRRRPAAGASRGPAAVACWAPGATRAARGTVARSGGGGARRRAERQRPGRRTANRAGRSARPGDRDQMGIGIRGGALLRWIRRGAAAWARFWPGKGYVDQPTLARDHGNRIRVPRGPAFQAGLAWRAPLRLVGLRRREWGR
jgi:hypothetical protein